MEVEVELLGTLWPELIQPSACHARLPVGTEGMCDQHVTQLDTTGRVIRIQLSDLHLAEQTGTNYFTLTTWVVRKWSVET